MTLRDQILVELAKVIVISCIAIGTWVVCIQPAFFAPDTPTPICDRPCNCPVPAPPVINITIGDEAGEIPGDGVY